MTPVYSSSLPRAYGPEFRQEALQQLATGQSLEQVARLMGVSKHSLLRWQKQTRSAPAGPRPPAHRTRAYSQATRQQAIDWLEQGKSASQIAELIGVCPLTVYRWKRQAQSIGLSATLLYQSTGQWACGPADTGSADPNTPSADQPSVATRGLDGRCRYDYTFKQRAMDKLEQGLSVGQVAKRMGVSPATLYGWKKAQSAGQLLASADADSEQLVQLGHQLQAVSHERDMLKQALATLLGMENT